MCVCVTVCVDIANGSSQVQNEHSHLVQTNCAIEGSICKSKLNGGSAASASNFMVLSSIKIKLQLFPADEHTRSGLEKVFDMLFL